MQLSLESKEKLKSYVKNDLIDHKQGFDVFSTTTGDNLIHSLKQVFSVDEKIAWRYLIIEVWIEKDFIFDKIEILVFKKLLKMSCVLRRNELNSAEFKCNTYQLNRAIESLQERSVIDLLEFESPKLTKYAKTLIILNPELKRDINGFTKRE